MIEDLLRPQHLLVILAVVGWVAVWLVVLVVPFWSIFRKAGFAPALSLLMIVPLVNLIMLFWVAFSEWPALKKPA